MDKSGGVECLAWTWGIAILVGSFVGTVLWGVFGWMFMQGAFMGVLCILILGALLTLMMCRASPGPVQPGTAGVNRAASTGAKAAAPAAAKAAPAKAAPAKPEADAAAASAAPAVAEGEGTRPEALDGPRGGKADDLKRIKGVGPAMEKLCNSLGFYHFDQIAAWTPEEVRWVDDNLEGFKGRVTRDEWVDQAKLLASGGETAFSKKVDDGDVY